MSQLLTQLLAAFSVTLLAIIILAPAARWAGLVDVPTARKRHDQAVPLIGGIAIFLSFAKQSIQATE